MSLMILPLRIGQNKLCCTFFSSFVLPMLCEKHLPMTRHAWAWLRLLLGLTQMATAAAAILAQPLVFRGDIAFLLKTGMSNKRNVRYCDDLWVIQIRRISKSNWPNTTQKRPATRRNLLCRQFRHLAKRNSQSKKRRRFAPPLTYSGRQRLLRVTANLYLVAHVSKRSSSLTAS